MNSHITNPALATNTPATLAAAICGWLSKHHQSYTFGADPKMPIYGQMDITATETEKRSASVQGVLHSAQRPPTVRKLSLLASRMGTLTFLSSSGSSDTGDSRGISLN